MEKLSIPFHRLAELMLEDLVEGRCVAITGLSNSGKSLLMRSLSGAQVDKAFRKAAGREATFFYVDCNRAVDISAQAFFEVVIRSALERLLGEVPSELRQALQDHHQGIIEAESAFNASLSFNLALTELCEQLDASLVLLVDEFDEIYSALEDRALLNLRALRDRFGDRLAYVTATVRALPRLRGHDVEGEFAELFTHSTHPMPLMEAEEAFSFLEEMNMPLPDDGLQAKAFELGGGHPGLLMAVAQALAGLPPDAVEKNLVRTIGQEPQPRAECLKIWGQLTADEQHSLISLAIEPEGGLPVRQKDHLRSLGLLSEESIFSPIFAHFVARKGRPPAISVEGVHLDSDSGDVWVGGVRIPVLTDLEFRLLQLLYERLDKLTDKYRIVTAVWGDEYLSDVDDARVEKLVSRLRSKIEPDPGNPRFLITQRGRGYKLLSQPRRA